MSAEELASNRDRLDLNEGLEKAGSAFVIGIVGNLNIAIVCEGFSRRSLLYQPWHRVHAISRRMAARKNLHVFIISDKTSNSSEIEEIDGITVSRVNRLNLLGIFGRRKLEEAVSKNDPDIVVWYGSPLSATYLNQLRRIGKPVIWDIDVDLPVSRTLSRLSFRELFNLDHNLFLPQLFTVIYPKFVMKLVANSRFVSRIIVPSQSLKDSMCKIGVVPEKIRIIPSAIERMGSNEFEDKKCLLRSAFGFDQTEFIVTYFGSPCTLRGTDTLVMSMKKILASKKNVKLVILSRRKADDSSPDRHLKNEEDYLRKLIKRNRIDQSVQIITGIMDKAQLINYLIVSDIIVLPFKIVFSEPPLSVLEAMDLGKVVVTTDVGALTEIIGKDRGILVEPSNVQALAQAILFLYEHPENTAQIAKKAMDFTADLWDWDEVTLRFEELLSETVKERCLSEKLSQ
jgi:phosphatidylinositol alpha-1,6-mannosyltransferase